MTEEEIEENAKSDPDALSPTDEQLKGFRRNRNQEKLKKIAEDLF